MSNIGVLAGNDQGHVDVVFLLVHMAITHMVQVKIKFPFHIRRTQVVT